jgi:hypothetical protein
MPPAKSGVDVIAWRGYFTKRSPNGGAEKYASHYI